jgi:hypothetical protein
MNWDNITLDIDPIVDNNLKNPLKRQVHPLLPDVSKGQVGLCIGKIKSGKSVLINNMYLKNEFFGDLFDSTYIISNSIYNDESSRFLREEDNVICFDSYDDAIVDRIIKTQSSYPKDKQPNISIIGDDLIGSLKQNAKLYQLCTRSRHLNIKNLVLTTQNFKSIPRIVRNNVTYLIVFWNINNEKELEMINEEYGHFVGNKFIDLYKTHIQKDPYAFMYINFENGKTYKRFNELLHSNY